MIPSEDPDAITMRGDGLSACFMFVFFVAAIVLLAQRLGNLKIKKEASALRN